MKLGRIIGPFLIAGGLFGVAAHAQFGVPWRHTPNVVVVSAAGDARLRLVDEAVAFWNKTLAEIGSGVRLGPVTHIVPPGPGAGFPSLGPAGLYVPGPP